MQTSTNFFIELLNSFKKPDVLAGIIGSTILTVLIGYIIFLFNTKKYVYFFLYSKFLGIGKKKIRFSISYLYGIKINGKNLLIKGNRKEQYQPVGGVFKYYSSAKEYFQKYGVFSDDNIPIDKDSKMDLRVKVNASNAYKFFEWFNSKKNREISIIREFREELIDSELIPKDILTSFEAEYIKTHFEGIKYKEEYKCYGISIAEIYHLKLSSTEQDNIEDYLNKNSTDKLILATDEEIERKCITIDNISRNISPTCLWTI